MNADIDGNSGGGGNDNDPMAELRSTIKAYELLQKRDVVSNSDKLLLRSGDHMMVEAINKLIMNQYQTSKKSKAWRNS